jgi:signal recognition particle subunit SRP54
MFDGLTERFGSVFDRITGRGALSEKDVSEAMREVRVALLEADVALPVVKDFIAFATERATGEDVIRSVKPADQVVKIVYDGLVEMLGGEEPTPINLNAEPARRHPDGRPAGLGQDDDLGQAGAAPDEDSSARRS